MVRTGDRAGAGRAAAARAAPTSPRWASSSRPCRSGALVPLESTAVCQIDPIAIAGESWNELRSASWPASCSSPSRSRRRASVGDRGGGRASGPHASTRPRVARGLRAVRAPVLSPGAGRRYHRAPGRRLQVRPKGRDADDLRDAYDAARQPGPRRQARLLPTSGFRRPDSRRRAERVNVGIFCRAKGDSIDETNAGSRVRWSLSQVSI